MVVVKIVHIHPKTGNSEVLIKSRLHEDVAAEWLNIFSEPNRCSYNFQINTKSIKVLLPNVRNNCTFEIEDV